jgi:hypothetical protein
LSLYVNGQGQPKFDILNGSNLVDTFTLPLTNEGGLTEKWEEVAITQTIISPSILNYTQRVKKTVLGWSATFVFDYSHLIQKTDLLNIKRILDYERLSYSIFLTPRIDIANRRYQVYFSGQEIDVNITRGGLNAIGNKSVTLEYKTVNLVNYFDVQDPDNQYFDWDNDNIF